ncbi:MAG TPA: hypothetical protein DDY49_12735 [Paenibacillaceae bacterium]|nr:hypothetical protein [Paenibacillaceae bacterium]
MAIVPYLHIIAGIALAIFSFFVADLKNWREYYPTILFFIAGDLLYQFITYDYPLWEYAGGIDSPFLTPIILMFTAYPATILLYLKYATKGWKSFIIHYFLWIVLFAIVELTLGKLNLILYANGWSVGWSIIVDFLLFLILRIHYSYPLFGWLLYFLVSALMILIFNIPLLNT